MNLASCNKQFAAPLPLALVETLNCYTLVAMLNASCVKDHEARVLYGALRQFQGTLPPLLQLVL